MTKNQYYNVVNSIKKYINAGDIIQAVPSLRFQKKFIQTPFSLYRSLRKLNPSPFLFILNFQNFSLVGSSPEILVRLKEDNITIRPIAGTRKRGKNEIEDKKLAKDKKLNTDVWYDEKSLNFKKKLFFIFFSVVENSKNHEILMEIIDFRALKATFFAKKRLS